MFKMMALAPVLVFALSAYAENPHKNHREYH